MHANVRRESGSNRRAQGRPKPRTGRASEADRRLRTNSGALELRRRAKLQSAGGWRSKFKTPGAMGAQAKKPLGRRGPDDPEADGAAVREPGIGQCSERVGFAQASQAKGRNIGRWVSRARFKYTSEALRRRHGALSRKAREAIVDLLARQATASTEQAKASTNW